MQKNPNFFLFFADVESRCAEGHGMHLDLVEADFVHYLGEGKKLIQDELKRAQ